MQPAFADTKQALKDFELQPGAPYALLYVEKHGGAPTSDKCIRVTQQSATRFKVYRYKGSQADTSTITSAAGARRFSHVGQGHFTSLCAGYATEPIYGTLLVKRNRTVEFSVALSMRELTGFTGEDKARVDSALSLVHQLLD